MYTKIIHGEFMKKDFDIPEITAPKNDSVCFKVSAEDKEIITQFCEENNWRVSAFCRVAVLSTIKNAIEKEK